MKISCFRSLHPDPHISSYVWTFISSSTKAQRIFELCRKTHNETLIGTRADLAAQNSKQEKFDDDIDLTQILVMKK